MSAVKVIRKLKAKIDSLAVSDCSVRRYIQALKDEISFKQSRYYKPVVDMVPGGHKLEDIPLLHLPAPKKTKRERTYVNGKVTATTTSGATLSLNPVTSIHSHSNSIPKTYWAT